MSPDAQEETGIQPALPDTEAQFQADDAATKAKAAADAAQAEAEKNAAAQAKKQDEADRVAAEAAEKKRLAAAARVRGVMIAILLAHHQELAKEGYEPSDEVLAPYREQAVTFIAAWDVCLASERSNR